MQDYVELANSYHRLLHWVETTDAERKSTALRSLEKIKRFLNESNVDVIDLSSQPFSEGWAVKVLKMDDTVPENELVFTRMIKPIIQINGEMVQEGEVYVGRLDSSLSESITEPEVTPSVTDADSNNNAVETENTHNHAFGSRWISTVMKKIKQLPSPSLQWVSLVFGVLALIIIIMLGCELSSHTATQADIAAVEKKVEALSLDSYRNNLSENHIVTYEIQNGENTIIITQPIGESVLSTIDFNGNPVNIITTNNRIVEGE